MTAREEHPAIEQPAEAHPTEAQEGRDRARDQAPPDVPRAMGLRVAFALMSLVGLGASIELIRLHIKAHTRPLARSFCSVGAKVDCLTVAESPYAVFAHVPVAVWATLAFTVLLAGSFALIWRQRRAAGRSDALAGVTFALSLGAVLVSGLMAYISHAIIGSLCVVCAVLYVVTPVLALLAWRIARRHGGVAAALAKDLRLLGRRPWPWIGFSGAILAVAGLLIWLYPAYWVLREPVGPGGLPHGVTQDGHYWIGARAPVLVVHEFSDYECGFCRLRNAHLRAAIAKADLRDRVRLVHHNYPLDKRCNPTVPREFHLRSCELARGALCAGEQGKFWEMNDLMFRRQRRRGGPSLLGLAGKLELDLSRFRACLAAATTRAKVRADIDLGERWSKQVTGSGIRGTPTYFFEAPGQPLRVGYSSEAAVREAVERVPVPRGPGGLPHGRTADGDPWIGARNPRLVIYEISDYQCYFCRRSHYRLRAMLRDPALRKAVRLVHLHYPFSSECNPAFAKRQHPRACALARAAVCAEEQGRFWEMNDLIFRRARAGRVGALSGLARSAGLDVKRFAACLSSATAKARLSATIARAEGLGHRDGKGIDGIPTIFLQRDAEPPHRGKAALRRADVTRALGHRASARPTPARAPQEAAGRRATQPAGATPAGRAAPGQK